MPFAPGLVTTNLQCIILKKLFVFDIWKVRN